LLIRLAPFRPATGLLLHGHKCVDILAKKLGIPLCVIPNLSEIFRNLMGYHCQTSCTSVTT
jgi:hypothetical protein